MDVKCYACQGLKKIMCLGGMMKACPECVNEPVNKSVNDSVTSELEKIIDDERLLKPKRPRGRPKAAPEEHPKKD